MLRVYEKLSLRIVKEKPVKESKYKAVTEELNPVFYNTPAPAFQRCCHILPAIFAASRANIEHAFGLLKAYDEKTHEAMLREEDEIDRMTDRLNKYLVGFLSHMQNPDHVAIMDRYYKVSIAFRENHCHCSDPEAWNCRE